MFMRKLLVVSSFLAITPLVFFFIIALILTKALNDDKRASVLGYSTERVTYAALPSVQQIELGGIEQVEAREEIVQQFLSRYGSPLEPHAQMMVEAADEYGLDYRLLPAIAMQESNLCKKAPEGSHNCWGYGIYGGKVRSFASYPEAIQTVTKGLAINYKEKGMTSPEEIMEVYAPSNDGSWARAVKHFMEQLQ